MLIVAEMNRASRRYTCSRCKTEIRRGELYILWRYSAFYSNCTEKYCLRCAAKEAELMLKHSVKRLRVYVEGGEDCAVIPVKDAPLPEEWRKKVMHTSEDLKIRSQRGAEAEIVE
jgi:hypothetical protein